MANTPVVRSTGSPRHSRPFVKIERSIHRSVKDRIASWIDVRAHRRAQAGQTVIEATSGKTCIGLSMECASGISLVVTMARAQVERRN